MNNAGGAGDLQPLVNLSDHAFDEAMKVERLFDLLGPPAARCPTMLGKKRWAGDHISRRWRASHGKPGADRLTARPNTR